MEHAAEIIFANSHFPFVRSDFVDDGTGNLVQITCTVLQTRCHGVDILVQGKTFYNHK